MLSKINIICFFNTLLILLLSHNPILAQNSNDSVFNSLLKLKWEKKLDSKSKNNINNWYLDGKYASVENCKNGFILNAGPEDNNNSHHTVIWTKESFKGNVRIDYDYERLDSSKANAVNIVYIQAQGYDKNGYDTDIINWKHLRTEPAMGLYFNYMNTYHISYATDGLGDAPESRRYVRGRRYMPDNGKGLKDTGLTPDYFDVNLFKTNVKYHITIIKYNREIYFTVSDGKEKQIFYFDAKEYPSINEGAIGFRQMYTRSAKYTDIKIMVNE